MKVLSGHLSEVNCVRVDQDKIISSSDDATIIIWNRTEDYAKIGKVLKGHSRGVEYIDYCGTKLFSGSGDATLRQWDMEKEISIRSYIHHTSIVRCVKYVDSVLFSASSDKTVKIWDERSGQVQHTLSGHQSEVFSLQILGNSLVSSSFDHTVKLWDLRKLSCVTSLEHSSEATALQMNENYLLQGTMRGDILVIERSSGESYSIFSPEQNQKQGFFHFLDRFRGNTFGEDHPNSVWGIDFDGSKIVAACGEQINVIDFYNRTLLYTINLHYKTVWSVNFDYDTMVSGSKDSSIVIYNFK